MGAIYLNGTYYGIDDVQVQSLPTASEDLVGSVYQYVGETDSNYTNCYWYKCVSDTSTTPATYSWVNVEVQNGTISMSLSQGEYDALSDDEKNDGTVYYVEDLVPFNPQTAAMGFTPVGTVISVMGNSAPTHYLACDGQVVNIVDYPELAYYFERQFGTKNHFGGDGTTTFGIPDLRGEFLRGTGTNSHTDQGSGANVGTHQDGTLVTVNWGSNVVSAPNSKLIQSWDTQKNNLGTRNLVSKSSTDSSAVGITTRPTNTSVLWCIATKNIYITPENNYSTDEQVVGTWIDNKPIYQKTIQTNMPTTTTSTNYAHNISNINQIISIDGGAWNGTTLLPINLSPTTSGGQLRVSADKTNITVQFGTAPSNTYNGYWTVKYTKTTD